MSEQPAPGSASSRAGRLHRLRGLVCFATSVVVPHAPSRRPAVTDPVREQLQASLVATYDIQRQIGAGGMAVVYLAHDRKHGRDVALKVLKPELGAVLGADRFLAEIRVTANLQHPNLLPLFDSGEAAGLLYYVMPYIEGETLRARLAREQQLPVDEVLRLVGLMANALDFAHAHGVIHRDLKPENILLQAGQPVIADFGIALAVAQSGGERITQTGLSLGTPHYMSPEQAAGEHAVDARSDQYALAAVTYEMLAGEPPHTGATAQMIIRRLMTETPRAITAVRPSVPMSVDTAVQRALSKSPADRFASCGEFAAALTARHSGAAEVFPTRRSARHTRTIAAVAVGLLAIAGAAFTAIRARSDSTLTLGRTSQLTNDEGLEIQPAISPDGKLVAYSAGNSARMRIYIRPASGGRTLAVSDDSTSLETFAQWSPDGNSLMFLSRGGVSMSSALGGASRTVVPPVAGAPVLSATWSPDGKQVAFVRRESLYVSGIDGAGTKLLASMHDPHSCTWSPASIVIACVSGNSLSVIPGTTFGNIAPNALVLVGTADGAVTQVVEPAAFNQSPVWSSDGRRLYFVSNRDGPRDVYSLHISSSGHADPALARVTTGLGAVSISLSADGRRMTYAAYTARSNIYALPIPAGAPVTVDAATAITTGSQVVEGIFRSRDGKWLMFDSNINGNADLFRVSTAGGAPERLSTDPADEFAPDLSPDGQWIAYHVYRSGVRQVEVRSISGGTPLRLGSGLRARWSPDGQSIAFMQFNQSFVALTHRNANGSWSEPRTIVKGAGQPIWYPDGKRLLYVATREPPKLDSTMVYDIATGTSHRLFKTGLDAPPDNGAPQFSVDGSHIFYKGFEGSTTFWVMNADGSAPRLLARFPNPNRQSYRSDFAVDASRIFFTIDERESDVFVAEMVPR